MWRIWIKPFRAYVRDMAVSLPGPWRVFQGLERASRTFEGVQGNSRAFRKTCRPSKDFYISKTSRAFQEPCRVFKEPSKCVQRVFWVPQPSKFTSELSATGAKRGVRSLFVRIVPSRRSTLVQPAGQVVKKVKVIHLHISPLLGSGGPGTTWGGEAVALPRLFRDWLRCANVIQSLINFFGIGCVAEQNVIQSWRKKKMWCIKIEKNGKKLCSAALFVCLFTAMCLLWSFTVFLWQAPHFSNRLRQGQIEVWIDEKCHR